MTAPFLKIYLPLFMLVYFVAVFVIPSIRTYRKTKINPITFSRRDNAHDYAGFMFKFCLILFTVMIFIFSLSEKVYVYLMPIFYLEKEALKITGMIMVHLSFIWIILAQIQMGISWRIGIDEKNKTKLVTHGLFAISRNPVFLGIIIGIAGLFLIIPNILSFSLALIIYFAIQLQVRLEEEFLQKSLPEEYNAYCRKTRRWV